MIIVNNNKLSDIYYKSPFENEVVSERLKKIKNDLEFQNLNLIPSENILTENLRKAMMIEVGNRYHLPTDFANVEAMPSRKKLHSFFLEVLKKVKELYKCSFCDIRLLSGIHLMMSVLGAFRSKTSYFLSLGRNLGGHSVTNDLAKSFGYKTDFIPHNNHKIDLGGLEKKFGKKPD